MLNLIKVILVLETMEEFLFLLV